MAGNRHGNRLQNEMDHWCEKSKAGLLFPLLEGDGGSTAEMAKTVQMQMHGWVAQQ